MTFQKPKPKAFIPREQIIAKTQSLAGSAFRLLLAANIESETARRIAIDAANAFGNSLLRDLPINGVEVREDKHGRL